MKKFFILIASLLFSRLVFACGTDIQREKMVERLYADADMQMFVCAGESCSMQQFEEGVQFHQYVESFHKKTILVCLVEPTLSATNSYTGVFAAKDGEYEFQFISYGTGIKVGENKAGIPVIVEYGVSDPDNSNYSISKYFWSGEAFIFSRNVLLHK